MSLPTVVMQPTAGMTVPTMIHMPDGSTVTPNASGQISITSNFVAVMIAAGWQIVVSGGTTHVP